MSEDEENKENRPVLRNKLAFSMTTLSFFFLIPGVNLPLLTVRSKGSVAATLPHFEYNFFGIPSQEGTEMHRIGINVFDTTRSILKTVHDLWDKDFQFVAAMILLFSVIVPVCKGLLLMFVMLNKNPVIKERIFSFIKAIGKWSMCDVFITAIFLAYLGTGATTTQNSSDVTVLGFNAHLNILVGMSAQLEIGFWCFLAYCLLSLMALQLYKAKRFSSGIF